VVTVEVLKAIADGAGMNELMQIVENEISDFLGGFEHTLERGLYMNAGNVSVRWAGGKINYW
jgi:hypothetical protein